MRERARLAGGSVELKSTPGAGTTLLLRLPPGNEVPLEAQTARRGS
jgi:chemotaxis protein histidine kinase CheA